MTSEQRHHVRAAPRLHGLELADRPSSPHHREGLAPVLDRIEDLGEVAGCLGGTHLVHRIRSSDLRSPMTNGYAETRDCMLICMHSTSVRIDGATHDELKRLATELHTTVGNTVSLAVRALRQDLVGSELTAKLRDDEVAWLGADLG